MKKIPYLADAFVQVLQDARYQARMSQKDLAEAVGCARSFISFMETGSNLPSLNAFMAMAEALDIPADEFMRRVQSRIRMLENARKDEECQDSNHGEDALKEMCGNQRSRCVR